MSEQYELSADNLKKIWNNTYGGRANSVDLHRQIMAEIQQDALDFSADFMAADDVTVTLMMNGREVTEPVSCCFARFGAGADAQWVVFQWYQSGYAEAVRPYTKDTANMSWLLEYIEKVFAA